VAGVPLLLGARLFRTRLLWETVKGQDAKRRKVEGLLQREQGSKSYWEDPLIHFMGLEWRAKRDSMTWRDWSDQLQDFVAQACCRWNLPLGAGDGPDSEVAPPPQKKPRTQPGGAKDRLFFRGATPEADVILETVAPLLDWSRAAMNFAYVTDSKALHGVVCGYATLSEGKCETVAARIMDRLVDHFACKWTPPQIWKDPVQWMSRDYNKVADGLADLTMDNRRSWDKRFATALQLEEANLVIQTDGGLREDCGAAAWVIGLWGIVGQRFCYQPLAAHGTYLEPGCTVFATEAIALDEASAEVHRLMRSMRPSAYSI